MLQIPIDTVSRRFWQRISAIWLVLILALAAPRPALATGTFVAAPGRVDLIHDIKRNLLYISSQDAILRYNIAGKAFLPPISLAGDLGGLDISPDGDTLAVANRTPSATDTTNSIFLVNLLDGTSSSVTFARRGGEGGTWSVAYGNDGRLLVSSRYQGSGSVPLRRYDPATGQTTELLSQIRQDSMLSASGDRALIAYAESNISSGDWGTFRVNDGAINPGEDTSWFNYEIGVNSSGTQFSIPTFGGTFVYGADRQKIATIGVYAGEQPVGVAYHPTEAKIYFPWAQTGQVRVYDAATLAQTGTYDFETTFGSNGNHAFVNGRAKVSRDGSLLAVSVAGGVRFVSLAALNASAQNVSVTQNTATPITLSADNAASGPPVSFSVITSPTHGTLSGSAPQLVYTPRPNYTGPDSFRFQASDGTQNSQADVTILVALPADLTAPDVKITTPPDRATITALPLIQGTASDNGDGRGLAKVEISLKRDRDGSYWEGNSWRDTSGFYSSVPYQLATTLRDGIWSRDASGLPSVSATFPFQQLTVGTYTLTATAFDTAGNQKAVSTAFTVADVLPDKTNPAVTITNPSNQTAVTALLTISGTAVDNSGGSGIARVDVFLKRNSDGSYWTGTVWGTNTPVALAVGLNRGVWGRTSSGLPSVNTSDPLKRLTEGTYLLSATAYDKAGNQKSIGSFFTVDRTNPTVTITNPSNRSFVRSLNTLTGTAVDSTGGSGIARVDVYLKRNADGKYWNGTAWGTTTPVALAVGLNKGTWGRTSSGLPSATTSDLSKRLTEGTYILTATAYDKANNQKSISHLFTVQTAPSNAASAPAS